MPLLGDTDGEAVIVQVEYCGHSLSFRSIFFFLSTYNSSEKIRSILSGEKICVRWFL